MFDFKIYGHKNMTDKYRHLHIKLTPQRLAIFKFMEGNKSHPSAEAIFSAVKKQYPTMSFATVYNTLDALKNKGGIRELKIDSVKKRYDPDLTPHHHMICVTCHQIFDLFADIEVSITDELIQGFKIHDKNIEITGLCRNCQ